MFLSFFRATMALALFFCAIQPAFAVDPDQECDAAMQALIAKVKTKKEESANEVAANANGKLRDLLTRMASVDLTERTAQNRFLDEFTDIAGLRIETGDEMLTSSLSRITSADSFAGETSAKMAELLNTMNGITNQQGNGPVARMSRVPILGGLVSRFQRGRQMSRPANELISELDAQSTTLRNDVRDTSEALARDSLSWSQQASKLERRADELQIFSAKLEQAMEAIGSDTIEAHLLSQMRRRTRETELTLRANQEVLLRSIERASTVHDILDSTAETLSHKMPIFVQQLTTSLATQATLDMAEQAGNLASTTQQAALQSEVSVAQSIQDSVHRLKSLQEDPLTHELLLRADQTTAAARIELQTMHSENEAQMPQRLAEIRERNDKHRVNIAKLGGPVPDQGPIRSIDYSATETSNVIDVQ